jgi:hypothetical protein
LRVLNSDECLAPDPLLTLPKPDHTYLTAGGKLKNPNKYALVQKAEELHPKYLELVKKGTATHAHYLYYRGMESNQHAPIAGIPRNQPDLGAGSEVSNLRGSEVSDLHGSEVRDLDSRSDVFPGFATQTNDVMTNNGEFQEESFHARPSIKLIVPDHIKAILVDDWENVTKNLQLVPLPAAKPVNLILNDYLQYEKPRRQAGSAQADILDEVVAGLKEYFEKCLGRILLYR